MRTGGARPAAAVIAALVLALLPTAAAHATDVDPFPDIPSYGEVPGTRVSGDVEITCPDGSGRGIEVNASTGERFTYCVKTWQPQSYYDDQAGVAAAQAQAEAEAWAAAALTPGVQVCKQWSYTYSNGTSTASGGVCVIVSVVIDTVTPAPAPLDTLSVTPPDDTITLTPAPIEPLAAQPAETPTVDVQVVLAQGRAAVAAAPAALMPAIAKVVKALAVVTSFTAKIPSVGKAARITATSLTPRLCRVTAARTVHMLRVGKCVVSVRVTPTAGKFYTFRQTWVRRA